MKSCDTHTHTRWGWGCCVQVRNTITPTITATTTTHEGVVGIRRDMESDRCALSHRLRLRFVSHCAASDYGALTAADELIDLPAGPSESWDQPHSNNPQMTCYVYLRAVLLRSLSNMDPKRAT